MYLSEEPRHQTTVVIVALAILCLCSCVWSDTFVGGTISSDTTWTRSAGPYVVTSNVFVQGSASPVLTVQHGVTVRFRPGAALIVGQAAPGALNAQGTNSSPIVFKADTVDSTPDSGMGFIFTLKQFPAPLLLFLPPSRTPSTGCRLRTALPK